GQDWAVARLKTPLAARIAEEAGYPVVSPYASAVVFLNGEYYGYMALNARIDAHFLQDLYNAPERAFEIADVGYGEIERQNTDSAEDWARMYASAEEWLRMVDLADQGLTDSTIEALERFIDIDDLLFYHAFQTYIANVDWLPVNMRVWRYTGDAAANGEGLDGRWRYVIYDLDAAFRVQHTSLALAGGLRDSAAHESPFYTALLQQPRYAEEFSNHICDLAYEHFSLANVERVIAEINKTSLQEIERTSALYEEAMRAERGIQLAPERENETLLACRAELLDFIKQRPSYALEELRGLFGYTSMYRVTTDGTAKINTLNGNKGQYFIENSVHVTPILEKGQAFGYWLVNGEARYEEELRVSFADADENGVVHVECVAREALPPLFFLAAYDSGDACGFTMYNPTAAIQSTRGLYLSDDIDNLKKWQFPDLNIRPGIVWEFVGQSSLSYDSLLKIGLNFNPRRGEVVFLSNEEGVVLDYMAVSD
ncbi:MAG: CotH kinase family protein, partial [Lachnospiraceae bacterium]|nr:CotH kinase family protein [Lachnospiraceae bacterium]